MGHFTKRAITLEAVRWDGNVIVGGCPDWLAAVGEDLSDAPVSVEPGRVAFCGEAVFIGTLEGTMRADAGDWIIQGTAGEIYPIKPDRFRELYIPTTAAAADELFGPGNHEIEDPPGVGRTELTAGDGYEAEEAGNA